MALKWMEGFELHGSQFYLVDKWGFFTPGQYGTVTDGRLFGRSAGVYSGTGVSDVRWRAETPILGQHLTWVAGLGLRALSPRASKLIAVRDVGVGDQIYVQLRPDSISTTDWFLDVMVGATTLATTGPYTSSTWYYIELKATIATTASGTYELRVNGTVAVSGTGVVTAALGNTNANGMYFELRGDDSLPTHAYIDDIYVCDGAGTSNNDFLGESIIEGILPTSNGDVVDWDAFVDGGTPTTQDYQAMDDAATLGSLGDGDASYIQSDVANAKNLCVLGPLAQVANAVRGIMVSDIVRTTVIGSRDLQILSRDVDDNENVLATRTISSQVYTGHHFVSETDPQTGVAWLATRLNTTQFGVKLLA